MHVQAPPPEDETVDVAPDYLIRAPLSGGSTTKPLRQGEFRVVRRGQSHARVFFDHIPPCARSIGGDLGDGGGAALGSMDPPSGGVVVYERGKAVVSAPGGLVEAGSDESGGIPGSGK